MPQLVSVQVKLRKNQRMLKKKLSSFSVNLFNKLSDIDNSVCTILMALYFILVLTGILP